jgi:hypothetical protein
VDLECEEPCLAMWIEVGDLKILLGADVEEHGDPMRGWSAITRPASRRGKRKEPAVDRTLNEARISIRDIEPPTGFVHSRTKPNSPDWTVTMSPEAITLDKFAA